MLYLFSLFSWKNRIPLLGSGFSFVISSSRRDHLSHCEHVSSLHYTRRYLESTVLGIISPLIGDSMHTKSHRVALQRCESYDRIIISELIDSSLHRLGISGSFHGKTVLLKPNFIRSSGPRLACTRSSFVAGAALWFLNHGYKELTVRCLYSNKCSKYY
jgi:hypothetical protein